MGVLSLLLVASVAGACPLPQRSGDAKAAAPLAGQSRAPEAATGGGLNLRLVRIAQGLTAPVYVTYAPGEPGRLYVVEQVGRIRDRERARPRPRSSTSRRLVRFGGEQGLLSIAFHPDYKQNRRFFVNYVNLDGDTVVAEYRTRTRAAARSGCASSSSSTSRTRITRAGSSSSGRTETSTSEWETAAAGRPAKPGAEPLDAARQAAAHRRGQKGARLGDRRIRPAEPLAVHVRPGQRRLSTSPTSARASGRRSTSRRATRPGLENYGWDVYEGTHPFEDKSPSGNGELVFPIHEYSHERGLLGHRRLRLPGVADPGRSRPLLLRRLLQRQHLEPRGSGGKATDIRQHTINVDSLSSFGQGRFGELYAVSSRRRDLPDHAAALDFPRRRADDSTVRRWGAAVAASTPKEGV